MRAGDVQAGVADAARDRLAHRGLPDQHIDEPAATHVELLHSELARLRSLALGASRTREHGVVDSLAGQDALVRPCEVSSPSHRSSSHLARPCFAVGTQREMTLAMPRAAIERDCSTLASSCSLDMTGPLVCSVRTADCRSVMCLTSSSCEAASSEFADSSSSGPSSTAFDDDARGAMASEGWRGRADVMDGDAMRGEEDFAQAGAVRTLGRRDGTVSGNVAELNRDPTTMSTTTARCATNRAAALRLRLLELAKMPDGALCKRLVWLVL